MKKVIGDRTAAMGVVTVPLDSGFTVFAGGHEKMTSKGGRTPPGISLRVNRTNKWEVQSILGARIGVRGICTSYYRSRMIIFLIFSKAV